MRLILYQRDMSCGKLNTNRSKCSWIGYTQLKNDFEDWLFNDNVNIPGEYIYR